MCSPMLVEGMREWWHEDTVLHLAVRNRAHDVVR